MGRTMRYIGPDWGDWNEAEYWTNAGKEDPKPPNLQDKVIIEGEHKVSILSDSAVLSIELLEQAMLEVKRGALVIETSVLVSNEAEFKAEGNGVKALDFKIEKNGKLTLQGSRLEGDQLTIETESIESGLFSSASNISLNKVLTLVSGAFNLQGGECQIAKLIHDEGEGQLPIIAVVDGRFKISEDLHLDMLYNFERCDLEVDGDIIVHLGCNLDIYSLKFSGRLTVKPFDEILFLNLKNPLKEFINKGTVVYQGSQFELAENGIINNEIGAVLIFTQPIEVGDKNSQITGAKFINSGDLRISNDLEMYLPFTNQSTLTIDGNVRFYQKFKNASGGFYVDSGQVNLLEEAIFSEYPVVITSQQPEENNTTIILSGHLTLDTELTIDSLKLRGKGSISGSGSLSIGFIEPNVSSLSGKFIWEGGHIALGNGLRFLSKTQSSISLSYLDCDLENYGDCSANRLYIKVGKTFKNHSGALVKTPPDYRTPLIGKGLFWNQGEVSMGIEDKSENTEKDQLSVASKSDKEVPCFKQDNPPGKNSDPARLILGQNKEVYFSQFDCEGELLFYDETVINIRGGQDSRMAANCLPQSEGAKISLKVESSRFDLENANGLNLKNVILGSYRNKTVKIPSIFTWSDQLSIDETTLFSNSQLIGQSETAHIFCNMFASVPSQGKQGYPITIKMGSISFSAGAMLQNITLYLSNAGSLIGQENASLNLIGNSVIDNLDKNKPGLLQINGFGYRGQSGNSAIQGNLIFRNHGKSLRVDDGFLQVFCKGENTGPIFINMGASIEIYNDDRWQLKEGTEVTGDGELRKLKPPKIE